MAHQSLLSATISKAAKFGFLGFTRSFTMSSIAASRKNCIFLEYPECSKEALAKKFKNKKCTPFVPTREQLECCDDDPCKIDFLPRFDTMYYRPSNKNRKYQRTWAECPKLRIEPKQVCCHVQYDYRKPTRRTRRPKGSIQTVKNVCERTQSCQNLHNQRCARINWPGCSRLKCKVDCKIFRPPEVCKKVCAPYPSYSECQRSRPKPLRPVECNCWKIPFICFLKK